MDRSSLTVAAIVLTAALAIGGGVWFLSRVTDAEPQLTISAERLAADYQENAAAADRKYRGRRILVEGEVDLIRSQDLALRTGVALMLTCRFRDSSQLVPLKPGQAVRVVGVCRSGHLLEDCSLGK